jgi:predicted amidohydrolase
MRIACGQLDIAWEDKAANYQKAYALLAAARLPAGSLFVLPELFATGFSMNTDVIAEAQPGATEEFLQGLARDHKVFVIAGMAARSPNGKARNQAVVVSPEGRPLLRYSKMQPFTLGGEADHYAAGTEVMVFDWLGCKVAPFVCYDLRFPELFRAAVRQGAEVFPVIANWPVKREMHWVTLLHARAIENLACVVGVNRCGTDPKFSYSGRSMIVDPHGIALAQIGNKEGVITADLDLKELRSWRKEFPALKDMRRDTCG